MPEVGGTAAPILVCVAWPYATSATHVGQIAGSLLPGDIFASYHRMAGNDVLMVSSSDMHGTPITVDADKAGAGPKEYTLGYHRQIVEVLDRLGMSFDLHATTISESHHRQTQAFFLRLLERGYIFADTMESPYCPIDRRFLPDRYVEGTCPYCEVPGARGDQCDNCGRTLDPAQLIDPQCRLCASRAVEMRETEHFFLDLPKFEAPLHEWLQTNKDHWRPSVLNFALNWIKEGLRPRSVTRDLDWGVPVPLPGYEDKRIYVWLDAVTGYYSASMEWANRHGMDNAWQQWWRPASAKKSPARSYYFIGKDNIAFHTIFWPAILMGFGDLNLPYEVPANEFMTMGGTKATPSRGNVVWTRDILDLYGADPVRYCLTSTMPEGRDTSFTVGDLARLNNDELVATYGNAVHRVVTFLQRNFDGRVPEPDRLAPADEMLLATVRRGFGTVASAIEAVHLREALAEALAVARAANRYLDVQAPWKAAKTERGRAATITYTMIQVLNGLNVLFAPFVPFSCWVSRVTWRAVAGSSSPWPPAGRFHPQRRSSPKSTFRRGSSVCLVSGLDLAAGRGISAVASLETGGGRLPRFVAGSSGEARTDDDILKLLTAAAPAIVAIDAPLSLPAPVSAAVQGRRVGQRPRGSPYTRAAERDPLWSSLGVRPLPVSFLGGLTFRAIALVPRLREALPDVDVIEVFPTATLRLLGIGECEPGRRRGSKMTPAARGAAQMALRFVVDGLPGPEDDLLGADLLDALAAALTAARHLEGSTQMLGDPAEGQIVVARASRAGVGGPSRVL